MFKSIVGVFQLFRDFLKLLWATVFGGQRIE